MAPEPTLPMLSPSITNTAAAATAPPETSTTGAYLSSLLAATSIEWEWGQYLMEIQQRLDGEADRKA